MKVIYVAGPFRSANQTTGKSNAWGVQQNVMRAMSLALEVWKRGCAAVCPHSNTMFFQDADGVEDRVWLDGDIELMKRCDGVLLTPDWARSSGARAEKAQADLWHLPVFRELDELDAWLKANRTLTPDEIDNEVLRVMSGPPPL